MAFSEVELCSASIAVLSWVTQAQDRSVSQTGAGSICRDHGVNAGLRLVQSHGIGLSPRTNSDS